MKFFIINVLFILAMPIAATAQSFWDTCDKAIDAGDTAEIAKQAKLMQTFKTIADANLGKAKRCVAAANDVELFYVEGHGFVNEIMQAEILGKQEELDQIWNEREAVIAERDALTSKYDCLNQQNDQILERILKLRNAVETRNLVQLKTATFEACKRKFDKDPDETLLNQTCQTAFNGNYFPGADTKDLIADWEQAQNKFVGNLHSKEGIDVALGKLNDRVNELEVKWKFIRGDKIEQQNVEIVRDEKNSPSTPDENKIIDCD